MNKPINPFVVQGYFGSKYFCNRKEETKFIEEKIKNGLNVTLISGRRKGKSILIQHVFHQLKQPCIYVDIYRTRSFREFAQLLTKEVFTQYGKPKQDFLKRATQFLKSIKPVLGYDSVTGEPQLSVLHHNDFDPNMSIREVFSFLSNEKHNVVIAIDEFQEICDWQDEKGEAALRTLVQSFPQLRFIFSGSNRKLMNEMFTHRKRPFYRSSELLFLPKIGAKDYINFASIHFRANSINIEKEVIGFVLDWCRHETYYIQRVLNRIYSQATKNMDREIILELLRAYLLEKESEFQVQLNLIPKNQRELITAIAIENGASQPTSAEFIKKYNLSSSSTVSQNLKSLVDKDLIEEEGEKYVVSDVFLNNWLRLK